MLSPSRALLATPLARRGKLHLWGAPGQPVIRMKGHHVVWKHQSYDIVVEHTHTRHNSDVRLIHYLGKHVPHPQKSLWSPDTPVTQDRHLFMLTTMDVDAFKYWFGVKRAALTHKPWQLLAKSGLMPPCFRDNSKIIPKPIFDKENLLKYYLANRRDKNVEAHANYVQYENGMPRSPKEIEADRPRAPWL
jgi:ribosomal protein S16